MEFDDDFCNLNWFSQVSFSIFSAIPGWALLVGEEAW